MKRVVGYTRLSTVDQSAYSLDGQDRSIKEYCSRHNLDLVAVFSDNGESSYTFDRPDFKALESFIRKHKVDYLIIIDYTRFSRNLAEALMKIKELENKFSIKVLEISESPETDFSDPTNFMMRAFKLMMAENELHAIRKRTRAGILQAALSGRFFNLAPYGYINAKDAEKKSILEIDEEKAFIVKLIFREYNRGSTIEQVRQSARVYGFPRTNTSAIQRILSNPVYAGLIKVPAHKNQKETLVKGIHTALVSEHEYWKAYNRLHEKKIISQRREEVPLRGVLLHTCGRVLTAGRSTGKLKKRYWYYVCHHCKVNLSAQKAHTKFNEILDHLSYSEESLQWFTSMLSEHITNILSSKADEVAKTQKAARIIEDKIKLTEEKFLTTDVAKSTFNKVMGSLRNQHSILQSKLYDLQTSDSKYYDNLKDVLPLMRDMRGLFEKLDLSRQQQFIGLVFYNSLSYDGTTYRTLKLLDIFSHNVVSLKEKGLLVIEQSDAVSLATSIGTEPESPVELLAELRRVLIA